MTIKYYITKNYGSEAIYLADEKQASLWCMLTNRKTISRFQMENLADLTGVVFERVFGAE